MTAVGERAPAEGATTPLVTISLVSYEGAAWLPSCLRSLAEQDFTDYELLIADNPSHDDSWSLLEAHAAADVRLRIWPSDTNLGYAVAHNRNIALARGEFVLLLNQDVELDPAFLSAALAAFRRGPRIGAVQGRLRQLGRGGERSDRLDTTGLLMGRDRRAISRAQGMPDGPDHEVAGPVWGVDGPAPIYRRSALQDALLPKSGGAVEVLDETFFLYKEDVDLAWRLVLLGWQTWYEPRALAWHARGTGGTGATSLRDIARTNATIAFEAKALSWRNQRLMQIKNETITGYLRDAPWILRRELFSLAFIVVFDPRRLAAVPALLRASPDAMRKRRYLQERLARADLGASQARASRPRRTWRRRLYDRLPDGLRGPTDGLVHRFTFLMRGIRRRSSTHMTSPGPFRRGPAGTILVIDDQIPEHDVHAGALTMRHYLRILLEAGLTVHFRPDDGLRREPYASALADLSVLLLLEEVDLDDWIEAHGRELDRVLLSRPHVARRWLRSIRRSSGARIVYLAHDLHYLRERRRYEATADPHALSESRRLYEIEGQLFRDVDVVITFSQDEVAAIKELAPAADVRVVTPAFYADPEQPGPLPLSDLPMEARRDVVFVGAFDHLPNVDAAMVLAREIMPLVWPSFPETRLLLIGGHTTMAIEALASDRITVTGHVPSLAPYWAKARVSVAPLRFGSGTKGKIISSLEAGVPVVTTAVGNEGIRLRDGAEVLLGDSPAELANHIVSLLADPDLAASLAAAGVAVVGLRFSEARVRADLLAALGSIEPRSG